MRAANLSFFGRVEIVARGGCFAVWRGLLELVDSVRCGACLELLCERGYSQLDSSGVGEAVSGYILYIYA